MEGDSQHPGPPTGQTDILSIKIHSDTMMFERRIHKCTQEEHK